MLILYVIALVSCIGLPCPTVQQVLVSGSKSPLPISVCLVCTTDVNKLGSWSSFACCHPFLLTPSSHLRSMVFLDIEMISLYLCSSPVCVIDLVTWQALQVDFLSPCKCSWYLHYSVGSVSAVQCVRAVSDVHCDRAMSTIKWPRYSLLGLTCNQNLFWIQRYDKEVPVNLLYFWNHQLCLYCSFVLYSFFNSILCSS